MKTNSIEFSFINESMNIKIKVIDNRNLITQKLYLSNNFLITFSLISQDLEIKT